MLVDLSKYEDSFFKKIQKARIFSDSKTFVDSVLKNPTITPEISSTELEITKEYLEQYYEFPQNFLIVPKKRKRPYMRS